jgi:hypothetical protein
MAKPRLRSLDDILESQSTFYDAINHAEPLVTSVIVTSYLDHLLVVLVEKLTIGGSTITAMLNPVSGVLGSFAAKANLAYCLGAISVKTKNNLDLIGQIRNRFSDHFGR